MKKSIICIGCPLGCTITVTLKNGIVTDVEGNNCKNGAKYARKEVSNPTRTVTSTIKVIGGDVKVLSVKTMEDIPKNKIFDCINALKNIEVRAPVMIGDIILKNVAESGADIVATKCVYLTK